MKKFFTFLLCVLFVSALSAQSYSAAVQEAHPDSIPVIGGDLDEAWDQADAHNITLRYESAARTETPSLGEVGETYWKALFVQATGLYILVYVADDIYKPFYDRNDPENAEPWMYDNVEVFLDCNVVKEDGVGGHGNPPFNGHYQLAPAHNADLTEDWDNGTMGHNDAIGYDYACNADLYAPAYFYEFFLPWSNIKDKDGVVANLAAGVGFEVAVADNDTGEADGRNRLVWSNDGGGSDLDSYQNMDNCGLMTFEGFEEILVQTITISGSDITEDGDTLKIDVEFTSTVPGTPPTNTAITWEISDESTASYKFDESTGILTPISDGTFIVTAYDASGFVMSNELTINISNQRVEVQDVSIIVDGFFENPQDPDEDENQRPHADWLNFSWNGYGDHTAYVEDGYLRVSSDSVLGATYNMKIVQDLSGDITFEQKDVVWVASWKMWATEDVTFPLHTENANGWGGNWANALPQHTSNAVPVEGAVGTWDIHVTTEPQWYSVRFNAETENMTEDTQPMFGWQVGHVGATNVFIDSVYIVTVEDSANLIAWDEPGPGVSVQNTPLSETTLKVYPNPASNLLNVSFSCTDAKTKVAIFNSVGIKMDEVEVYGNHHVFDVSNYASGIYLVKAKDKFVKFVR